MKKLLLIASFFIITTGYSQTFVKECWDITKNEWKNNKIPIIAFSISGAFDAGAEVFDADPNHFRAVLGINPNSKFAGVDCLNNWRTSNMPFASTAGIPFVDIYHNMRGWETTGYIVSFAFMVGEKNQNWKVYAIRTLMLIGANKIMFNGVMHGIFAMPY